MPPVQKSATSPAQHSTDTKNKSQTSKTASRCPQEHDSGKTSQNGAKPKYNSSTKSDNKPQHSERKNRRHPQPRLQQMPLRQHRRTYHNPPPRRRHHSKITRSADSQAKTNPQRIPHRESPSRNTATPQSERMSRSTTPQSK